MEPKPIPCHTTPAYPTRRELLAGAATFAAASFCGRWCVFAESNEGTAVVAPIFEHGEGRGATGCIVHSPPVFLSEEEAMQIIREELAKYGFKLKPGAAMKDVRIARRIERLEQVDKGNGKKTQVRKIVELSDEDTEGIESLKAKPLGLSGFDLEKRVAVKYVSQENHRDLGGLYESSTVQVFNFKEVAGYIADQVARQSTEKVWVGLFYDPAVELDMTTVHAKRERTSIDAAWKETEVTCKNEARNLLRQQAQDFAAWLKHQKVIK